ncbi:MAG: hypothetical protein GX204_07210 [Acholeplasmataceae bacterium]|nr:hypothetical protein [Acholeplasmataceae bacterium]
MEIRFSKYHGLGNDFLIVDARDGADYQDLAKKICDRRFGVGADGHIVYRPPREMLFSTPTEARERCAGMDCAAWLVICMRKSASVAT